MGGLPIAGERTETPRAEELALHRRLHDQGGPPGAGSGREGQALRTPRSKPMPGRGASASLTVLLAALLVPAAALAETSFTSVQGGYSVSFPAEPRETVQTQPEGRIVSYLL